MRVFTLFPFVDMPAIYALFCQFGAAPVKPDGVRIYKYICLPGKEMALVRAERQSIVHSETDALQLLDLVTARPQ